MIDLINVYWSRDTKYLDNSYEYDIDRDEIFLYGNLDSRNIIYFDISGTNDYTKDIISECGKEDLLSNKLCQKWLKDHFKEIFKPTFNLLERRKEVGEFMLVFETTGGSSFNGETTEYDHNFYCVGSLGNNYKIVKNDE